MDVEEKNSTAIDPKRVRLKDGKLRIGTKKEEGAPTAKSGSKVREMEKMFVTRRTMEIS